MKIEMSYLLLAFATVLAPLAQGQSTPKAYLCRRKTPWTSSSFRSGHSCRSGYC
jgi:hypothetical protein